MNESEILALAIEHIDRDNHAQWEYEIGAPKKDQYHTNEWNIAVRWLYKDGTPLDGPSIVIVDSNLRTARFL